MKNEEKYTTVGERVTAFRKMCKPFVGNCGTACKLTEPDKFGGFNTFECFANWLALEAEEEKPEPCPFCGGECRTVVTKFEDHVVGCDNCCYCSRDFDSVSDAVAAHNRVARAVRTVREKEVK